MKLTGGLQRVTIERKKGSGLGCTIKSIGGIIFVNRILEHGTVSSSGALRPGDQLLDVNGIELAGRTVGEVCEIIRSCPECVVCTVKPVTDFRVVDTHDAKRADYAELDLSALKLREYESASSGSEESLSDTNHQSTECGSEKRESSEKNEEKKTEKQDGKSYEEPKYDDVIPRNIQRRHSLPSHTTPGDTDGSAQERDQEEDLQYLELEFPVYDRPRLKSDPTTKPPNKNPVAPIAAYAYIELDFTL
ncbi:hypothetical protein QZH41_010312 [Actinostola sp. cb2023]|nr:hypothetical protein QZH41_010312 [Actinostola sp. cb2023]